LLVWISILLQNDVTRDPINKRCSKK